MLTKFVKSLFWKMGFEVKRKQTQRVVPPSAPLPSAPLQNNALPNNAFKVQRDLLARFGVDHPTIFDIGANFGQTVQHYREVFQESMIYCFEPFPACVNILKNRFDRDSHIRIVPMAVADTSGSRLFHINESTTEAMTGTNSLLSRPSRMRRYFPKQTDLASTTEVQVTTIDEFIENEGIEKIDILKFDIQGGELSALKGAVRTLTEKQIPLIYLEAFFIHHYENSPLLYHIWSYLTEYGYTLYNMYDLQIANNGQLRFADVIFVNREMREKVINTYPEEP